MDMNNTNKRDVAKKMLLDNYWQKWSDYEIAKKVGLDARTIATIRRETGVITKVRYCMRNGKKVKYKIDKIGQPKNHFDIPTKSAAESQYKKIVDLDSDKNYLMKGYQDTYVFYSQEDNRCKIGVSKYWPRRLQQINTSNATEYVCYGIVTANIEQVLHFAFERYRLNGEWFSIHPDAVFNFVRNEMNLSNHNIHIFQISKEQRYDKLV
jgi:hypothetical protein